ncbi:MAG: chloride channel protein [Sphingobacteriales bacterium]|nr:chloride channel protein [Sphingobacteriales bacterium]
MHRLIKRSYQYLSHLLRTRLSKVQYMMVVSVMVGFASGIAAVLMKTLVHYVHGWIELIPDFKYSYFLLPALGLLITFIFVKYFMDGNMERGIPMVLKAIARKSSFIPLKHTYAHIITSSVTVATGGSVGLEAPIVATGSAVGSNIAKLNEVNYRERTLMIACGAAAGIAAVFNAPIAGVIFAIEVLLTETIVVSYFIPLITATVTGTLVAKIILKESILFNFSLKQNFNYHNTPFYILLGFLCGFLSLYYARVFKATEHKIHYGKMNGYGKAIFSGLLLGGIYFIFPPLFGEGYETVRLMGNDRFTTVADTTTLFSYLPADWAMIIFTGLIILLKPVAAGVTIGGGGNGGNFAPSLFAGSFVGFFFSRLCNITGLLQLPVGNFSLIGMAGMLSGVMYCPLTGIFLIAEVTNGYELFIPLMIVSSISFFIVKQYEAYSMDTKQLAKEGQIFTHEKEKNILTTIRLEQMLQGNYGTIGIDKKLKQLIEVIKRSEKNIYAVLDHKQKFAGIIELNDIKQKLFEPASFNTVSVKSVMKKPPAVLFDDENMLTAMEKFDISNSWYLPVLTRERDFVGFVSKTKVFKKYREILADQGDLY